MMKLVSLIIWATVVLEIAALDVTEDLDGFFDGAIDEDLKEVLGQTRIVGGNQAARSRYPYFTRVDDSGEPHCGGVLIHNDIVLTAAHCANTRLSTVVNAYVTSGDYESQIRRSVQYVIKHPNYGTLSRSNDFAIIKLATPVNSVTPIALNDDTSIPRTGDGVTVIGVGSRKDGGDSTGVLDEVLVNVISDYTCNLPQSYDGQVIPTTMFCAGTRNGGKDSCQGDSGGPVIQVVNGRDILVGIVSWGEGCARAKYPGVYAKLSSSLSWIEATICTHTSVPKIGCPGVKNPEAPAPMMLTPAPVPMILAPVPMTIFPTVALVPITDDCDDDEYTTFSVPAVGDQTCKWLRARPTLQEKLCKQGSAAFNTCKETCGQCKDNCIDSSSSFSVGGILRNCLYISLRPNLFIQECQPGNDAYDMCKETCNSCPGGAPLIPAPAPRIPLPTPGPILGPVEQTPAPGDRTKRPTPSPTPKLTPKPLVEIQSPQSRSSCDDSVLATFYVKDLDQDQHCIWLAARKDYIQTLCVEGHKSGAREACPETCGVCTDNCVDSELKFDINGVRRNCLWLSLRINEQIKVCHPSNKAWTQCLETCNNCPITESPIVFKKPSVVNNSRRKNFCDDDNFGTMYINSHIGEKKCSWLAHHSDWQTVLCAKNHASGARDLCAETCGKCSDLCEDSSTEFIDDNGFRRDCDWLSRKPKMQEKYCMTSHAAYDACHESCNSC